MSSRSLPAASGGLASRACHTREGPLHAVRPIAPVLIVARLEEFAYGEATAIAMVLLVISFSMLVLINVLERWTRRADA